MVRDRQLRPAVHLGESRLGEIYRARYRGQGRHRVFVATFDEPEVSFESASGYLNLTEPVCVGDLTRAT